MAKREPKRVMDVKRAPKPKTVARAGGRGKPSVFTARVRADILGAVREGVPHKYAAHMAGVSERVLQKWIKRGRENLEEVDEAREAFDKDREPDPYGRFVAELWREGARARAADLQWIRQHGRDDWRALAWLLERTDNREFGRPVKLSAVSEDEDGQEVDAVGLILDTLGEIAERREALESEGD